MKKRLFYAFAALCLIGVVSTIVGMAVGCSHPTAAGIEPMPDTSFAGRRAQVFLPAEDADMAVVFVGGFTESTMAHFRSCYETMPPLPCKGRQLRAFYDWEGGNGNLLCHNTERLQRDLRAFMQRNPRADIVLLGHSYGGSARDADGNRFRHRNPLPLLMEPSPVQGTSPYEQLCRRCCEGCAGARQAQP